jgi:hypothetical protein
MKCALFLVLLLAACTKAPEQSTHLAGPGEFQIDRLFTHDNCTVYRFEDAGRYVYYTNCEGQTQSSHGCGKSCTTTDYVTTEKK